MWDFSWIERRWPGAGYEDWDKALDDLKMRGYDVVRIDAFPHLLSIDSQMEWELLPHWNQNDWGSPALNRVVIQPSLNQFIRKCKDRKIKVALSSWYRTDRDNSHLGIVSPEKHAQIWIKTLDMIEKEDLLDNIYYVDLCNEWPLEVWAPYFICDNAERIWSSYKSLDWMKIAINLIKSKYPELKFCFSFSLGFDKWKGVDLSFFDILEIHIWMAQCSDLEFYKKIHYNYERFDPSGYQNIVKYAEKLYRESPEYWLEKLKKEILNISEWSLSMDLPIITTECWSVVDYKDWPLLNWEWVKEICEFGVGEALKTKRWAAMATSNFCGPQFRGMWDDIAWHKKMTEKIHKGIFKCR
jgi:hypothetical protein